MVTGMKAGRVTLTPWQKHVDKWKDCECCHLYTSRTQVVLARGEVPCQVCFVGEGPGVSEDALGQPFIGNAGKLLDSMVAEAMEAAEIKSLRASFTNLVACIPRDVTHGVIAPPAESVSACHDRLSEFIHSVAKPKIVVAVGTDAKGWLSKTHDLAGMAFESIDHPSFILRSSHAMRGHLIQRAVIILRDAFASLNG